MAALLYGEIAPSIFRNMLSTSNGFFRPRIVRRGAGNRSTGGTTLRRRPCFGIASR
jgi:hypothetical protein